MLAETLRFPDGFLWGAATSSHQVEGGDVASDWTAYERDGRLPFAAGDACRHFERYAEDLALARSLGHNACRLSLEWSRFEPEEGRWDPAAVQHYREVLDAARANGLEPLVTLHHFTNPAWFLERGGWTRADAPRRFAAFVAHAARELGDRATLWATINEPTVYARHAYVLGEWPPLVRNGWLRAVRCLRYMARAHVAAYRVLHELRPDARVGLAHAAAHLVPCDPARGADRRATALRDRWLNAWFLDRIGGARHLDWLGLNYYTRTFVRSTGLGAGGLLGRACKLPHHDRGPSAQTGWEMHAPGLEAALARFARLGVPLYVTENGVATDDEALRARFLHEHVASVGRALERGADVRGYFWWSLMDNYEWALGWTARYGLCSLEGDALERRPRPCALALERIARANALESSSA